MRLADHVWRIEDTCHVYAVTSGATAITIDFGAGRVLEQAAALGIGRLTDVLMTHHHRDQGAGLPQAVASGSRVWVPHAEQDLFHAVDAHWQAREIFNNYNVRQDRFSLLDPVPIAGALLDYGSYAFGNHHFTVIPTPGHTTGSISLLATIDGQRVAFTGDLMAGPGQLWSLAATQWTYNGGEGLAGTVLSLLDLKARRPDILLPSHGDPITQPDAAIDLLIERLTELMHVRQQNPRLFMLRTEPYIPLTPHLLWNRTSMAYSYVLLSESGKALLFDFGYDFMFGGAAGSDRASRRPWLYTLPELKRQFGVQHIDAVIPTHYHDDHVAGLNLLRDIEGTQVWAAENFADILEHPGDFDLPCLWYDPIAVDRVLPLGVPIRWEEYELMLHLLPGHTRYAVAISVLVDGKRVLVAGDQYQGDQGTLPNYVYHNQFQPHDYRASATLYRRLAPDLILTGHWLPLWVQPDYFDQLDARGEALDRLHQTLLPDLALGLGSDGFAASIRPYQHVIHLGETLPLVVTVRNPYREPAPVMVRLIVPSGWHVAEDHMRLDLAPGGTSRVTFHVTPRTHGGRRRRVAADVTIHDHHYGQQAEALITVLL